MNNEIKQTAVVTIDGKVKLIQLPKKTVFNQQKNNSIDWASWSWNPATGCNHGCSFCYARDYAHSERMAPYYPFAFEPAFYEFRLQAPKNTAFPKAAIVNPEKGRVFVCSMADLFGKWVPDEWIAKVFDSCNASPAWTYIFLTKWPKRYAMLETLPKAWFGASIIQQSDVGRVERDMIALQTDNVKWISLEPMLEPIIFNDLSWCDLVVIGGQTGTHQPSGYVKEFMPEISWIKDVIAQCEAQGVPYYLKDNIDKLGLPRIKMLPTERIVPVMAQQSLFDMGV